MELKIIAICSNISIFWNNKCLDYNVCSRYPGALWMPILNSKSKILGNYRIVSGDVALKMKDFSNVYIIQELNAKHGKLLINKGAKPFLITGFESPLYSYFFYDNLKRISKSFKIKYFFSGAVKSKIESNPLFFPTFSINDLFYNKDWDERKFSVMIAANKNGKSPIPKNINQFSSWLIHEVYKSLSPSFNRALRASTHIIRKEVIKFFGALDMLDLYGSFWLDRNRFSRKELEELYPILEKLNPIFVKNKLFTLSNYKFCFCFENTKIKGYLTEKIIDCFIAGVIPVYLGADDIDHFIPKNTFINFRDFESLNDLKIYLSNLKKTEALKIISNAQSFLKSPDGVKFSFEHFADNILNKVAEYDHN